MGDMADHLIEQGMDSYFAHLHGDCDTDGPCQECEEREVRLAKRRKADARRRKAKRSTQEGV